MYKNCREEWELLIVKISRSRQELDRKWPPVLASRRRAPEEGQPLVQDSVGAEGSGGDLKVEEAQPRPNRALTKPVGKKYNDLSYNNALRR